jgi:SAM-dependent methyltransferase
MICRNCKTFLKHTFLDLGYAPPSNAYLSKEDLNRPEAYFPLKIKVCHQCWLVQTEDYAQADKLFGPEYAYFSSTSSSWLTHAKRYAEKMIIELCLNKNSLVIEVGSNDGYLLKNFVGVGIPCLGIEPTDSTAAVAEQLGVPMIRKFFGEALGKQLRAKGQQADLIVGNNVYAHVPDINDFTSGLKAALKPGGTITIEFPHLMNLIEHTQFDTIYHEHFSYLSLSVVEKIFKKNSLRIYHAEEIDTHGGSLRIYGCHANSNIEENKSVQKLIKKENKKKLNKIKTYEVFDEKIKEMKYNILSFLLKEKKNNKKIYGYGAAAKASTLINYCGIKNDLIKAIYDAAASKQNKLLPGSHIPILHPKNIKKDKPDIIIIFPWNLSDEIIENFKYIKKWNCKFIVFIPKIRHLK